MDRILNFFKRKYKRLRVKLRNRVEDRTLKNLTPSELKTYKIINTLLSDKESELLFDYLETRMYIHKNDMYVIMKNNNVYIVNGSFLHETYLTPKVYDKLKNRFLLKLNQKRDKLMETILSKTEKSLDTILLEIENRV